MGCEIGGATGTEGAPGSPFGGIATRTPVDEPLTDEVAADAPVLALARPPNPIAAIVEKTAESVSETATVMRVIRDTDRMPVSRVWPILLRFRAGLLDRMPVISSSVHNGGLSSFGISFEIDVKARMGGGRRSSFVRKSSMRIPPERLHRLVLSRSVS